MVDAYADLVADQRSVPRDVHELVAPGATRDDGRRACWIRIRGGVDVVVAVRTDRGDGIHQHVDLATEPPLIPFEPDALLIRQELVQAAPLDVG